MDRTRTLPPLVRGKVTGVLDFFIDEVTIFRNILLLTDNCDIVVQVQWWGELLPICIRPQEVHLANMNYIEQEYIKNYFHSAATYEIKTKLELFKSYLKTCDVLELAVSRAVENLVIGSAFLKDLINILDKNNEVITLPIINYSGDVIGDLKTHINFTEKSLKNEKSDSTQILENKYLTHEAEQGKVENSFEQFKQEQYFLYKRLISSSDEYISKQLKSLILDLKAKVPMLEDKLIDRDEKTEKYLSTDVNEKIKQPLLTYVTDSKDKPFSLSKDEKVKRTASKPKQKLGRKSLPETHVLGDGSKILCFKVQNKGLTKTDKKVPKLKSSSRNYLNLVKNKTTDAFHSKTIRSNAYDKTLQNLGLVGKKLYRSISETLSKPVKEPLENNLSKKKHKNNIKPQKNQWDMEPVIHKVPPLNLTESSDSSLEYQMEIPVKKTEQKKVLDYLLFSEMTKEEEEKALNNFLKMSPCFDLVENISELCTGRKSSKSIYKSQSKRPVHAPVQKESPCVKVNSLSYDLSNPIERVYYETFFKSGSNSSVFEIAELLNQPETKLTLENWKETDHNNVKDNPQNRETVKSCTTEVSPVSSGGTEDRMELLSKISEKIPIDYENTCTKNNGDCSHCKYKQKLQELDSVIESLKHFEEKVVSSEKLDCIKFGFERKPIKSP